MQKLPFDCQLEIVLWLELPDLRNLCLTCSHFNRHFNQNDQFWWLKCQRSFITTKPPTLTWRQFYLKYHRSRLYVFGNNGHRNLGLGDDVNRNTPTRLPKLHVRKITTGDYHSCLIDFSGQVWVFGDNDCGQLGLGDKIDRSKPTRLPHFIAKKVAAGSFHTLLVDLEDNLYSCGNNRWGQLGLGDKIRRCRPTLVTNIKVSKVTAKQDQSLVIDFQNQVWACGFNRDGRLGFSNLSECSRLTLLPGLLAKKVIAGNFRSAIIDLVNRVWFFGDNPFGYFTELPEYFWSNYHQRHPNPSIVRINSPVTLPQLQAKKISLSRYHQLILDTNQQVWVFGDNEDGQLGLGDNDCCDQPVQLLVRAKDVATGDHHSIVVDSQSQVWSFGDNRFGQLGLGDNDERNQPTLISGLRASRVIVGPDYSLVIGYRVDE